MRTINKRKDVLLQHLYNDLSDIYDSLGELFSDREVILERHSDILESLNQIDLLIEETLEDIDELIEDSET